METVMREPRIATAGGPVLDEILREGARAMLRQAIERGVAEYVAAHAAAHAAERDAERDAATGRRLVVRNGHLPARKVLTGPGPIEVRRRAPARASRGRTTGGRPADDRRTGPATGERRFRFTPEVLPPYPVVPAAGQGGRGPGAVALPWLCRGSAVALPWPCRGPT